MITKKLSSASPTLPNTPLRNLFAYIRDLYTSAEPVYRFNEEAGNNKVKDSNYWELSKLLQIYKLARQKTAKNFSHEQEANSCLVRLKRIAVPELQKPSLLEEWLIVSEYGEQLPTLSVKEEIQRINSSFDSSAPRVQAFNRYKRDVEKRNSTENNELPDILAGWITTMKKEDGQLMVEKNETGTTIEKFEDNKERITKYNKYEKYFADYYNEHWDGIRVNRLYDALHQLHYELKGSDSKKLYLSFGLVSGRIGGIEYQNFLFHVPLLLNLKNQEIKIEYDTFANKIFCEQNFSELLEAHFTQESPYSIEEKRREILKNVGYFNAQSVEFYLDNSFIQSTYYETALRITGIFSKVQKAFFMGGDLDYTFYPRIDAQQIMLSFSPIIQTRHVATQIAVSKDASNIIQKINELEAGRQLSLIPDYFKKLFSITGEPAIEIPPTNGFHVKRSIMAEPVTVPVSAESERFLFPLPYNEEQLTIARRLTEQDAVTVKGPPGTGKSHTIANLISHFVAQGKSILVISHNAKALTVLKDKLPKQIQDLAISLVNENKGNETLKASVNSIVSHLAQNYDEKEIKRLEEELAQLEQFSESVKENIYQAIQANTISLRLQNPVSKIDETYTAYEWAKQFTHLHRTGIVIDKVNCNTDTSSVAAQIVTYIKTTRGFTEKDFDLTNYNYQEDVAFIPVTEFKKIEQQMELTRQAVNLKEYEKVDYKIADAEFNTELESFLQKLMTLQELSIAPQISRHPNFNRSLHMRLLQENAETRELTTAWDEKLLTYNLDTDSIKEIDPDILHKQILELIGKFENNQTLGFLTKKLLSKESRRFFECKINAITANELPHFKILELYIHRNKKIKQLGITFGNYLKSFGINYLTDILPVLTELDFLADFNIQLEKLNQVLETRKIPALKYPGAEFNNRLDYLRKLGEYVCYKQLNETLQGGKKTMLDHTRPHPLIQAMAAAIDNTDRAGYEQLLETYREVKNKCKAVEAANTLYDSIAGVLPQTIVKIKAAITEQREVLHITADDIEQDIFYLKLESFLKNITRQTIGTDLLFERLQTIKANIENKIAEVVAYRSWYHKTKLVDDTQKSALNAWLNDLINIGRGFGKNTARNIQSAIQNMQVAKGAVPIWIMKQESAITFFPDVSPAQFDLLIIDEASQCDISSLNLVFRCKKSIIVGDENQTSVSIDSMQFPIEKTNQILDKYLISHPFKQQFNINNKNNSIYTLSGVIYPNIVVLKEHFRCLPEIIGFSNSHVYNNDIIPLKTATDKPFGEPVEIHYIADGPQEEDKPLLVEKVIALIEGYITAYEQHQLKRLPTVGIITLDSSNIRHQNQLIRGMAKSQLIKQYEDKLDLLIGTSREFQGDERDIMFLTITASHSYTDKGELRPPRAVTGEEFMRIYNVAASRAKEKSVLLHSIHPEAIPVINPDCYRKKLLDYYAGVQNKPAATIKTVHELLRLVDARAGTFEKEVCEMLYREGLAAHIHPQYQVGLYKIDFGIIMHTTKLAIECDGMHLEAGKERIKDDIARQLILERAGWRFFRIQSTEWFYDKEQVSKKILVWIEENTRENSV
jgi:very-short-patch-repair endonuclease/KaiC/GvpD/RAD55 family RecA-like ATPase